MDSQSLNFLADRKRFRLQPLITTSIARSFCSKTSFDDPGVPYKSITLNQPVDEGSLISGAKLLDFVSAFQGANASSHIKECTRKFTMQSESYKKFISPYEQLTSMTLASTYLVGGFVGSKSQVGGASRGGFGVQIWDIILDKFVELMGTAVHTSNGYCEDFFRYEEFSGNVLSDEHTEYVTKQTEHATNNSKRTCEKNYIPHVDTVHSKQSYADVTKTVAHHTPVGDNVSASNTRLSAPILKTVNSSVQKKNRIKSETWQENINRKEKRRPSNHGYARNSAHSQQKHTKGLCKMSWKDKQEARNVGMEYAVHEMKQYRPNENNNRNNKYSHVKNKVINQNKKNNSESSKVNCKMNTCLEITNHKTGTYVDPKKRTLDTGPMLCEEDNCVSSIVNLLKTENFSPDLEISDKNCPMIKVGLNFSLLPRENKSEKEHSSKMEDVNERCRYLSECSVDSDDSFVVFDAGGYNETESADSLVNDDCNESDSGEEEEEEEDDSVWTDDSFPSDEDDECVLAEENCELITKKIEDANARWCEQSVDPKPKIVNKAKKKVRFAEGKLLTCFHPMIAWDFALRSARIGPWETLARDTVRFQNRISRTAAVLDPILQPSHRERIYKERFMSDTNESV